MPLIINSDIDTVNVQAFGNWFTFKAGQTKNMDKRIVDFLDRDKRSYGLVALPEVCEESPGSEEAKKAIEAAIQSGRGNIIQHLNSLITNLEQSFQTDVERSKEHVPSAAKAAHLPYYRKLAQFKASNSDKEASELAEIEKLKGQIDGTIAGADTRTINKRS